MNSNELLSAINIDLLTCEETTLISWEIGIANSADEVAKLMCNGGPYLPQASAKKPKIFKLSESDSRPDKKYWSYVKKEIYSFICEENPKYNDLYERLDNLKHKTTGSIILVVSGYIGEKLGVEASVISGFVAVCFYGALKISKEAYCEYIK